VSTRCGDAPRSVTPVNGAAADAQAVAPGQGSNSVLGLAKRTAFYTSGRRYATIVPAKRHVQVSLYRTMRRVRERGGRRRAMATADTLVHINTIYHEPAVFDYARGRQIRARYPQAALVEVPSHWQIPDLHGNEDLAESWNRVKRTVLVLGVKKGLQCRPFYRSCDFVAPSSANGCAMACAYCYVARRKGYANPITTFVNIDEIAAAIERHAARQGFKWEATQADPTLWTYELGTNSDCAVDATISDNVRDLVALFRRLPNEGDLRHQVRQRRSAHL